MTTLLDFEKKKKRRLSDRLLQWNVDERALVDGNGEPITGAIVLKALKFLDMGLVQNISSGNWKVRKVLPIEGYNSTTYTVRYMSTGGVWYGGCNCQCSVTKGKKCSHMLAVMLQDELPHEPWVIEGNVNTKPERAR